MARTSDSCNRGSARGPDSAEVVCGGEGTFVVWRHLNSSSALQSCAAASKRWKAEMGVAKEAILGVFICIGTKGGLWQLIWKPKKPEWSFCGVRSRCISL
jgi:hypothetical protein